MFPLVFTLNAAVHVYQIGRIKYIVAAVYAEEGLTLRERVKRILEYTDAMPPKLPLEEEKEFRPIRNAVVKAAVMLGSEMQDWEPSKNAKAQKKTQGTSQSSAAQSGHRVSSEAIAHAFSLVYYASRIIRQSAPQFTEEEDYEDIDRELKREIRQVKNGEPMMLM